MSIITTKVFNGTSPYEPLFGYSRAVRRGPFIHVSGTTSVSSSGAIQHPESAYLQTITAFKEALRAIEGLGGNRDAVVRVRLYVRDQGDSSEVGRGMRIAMHGEGSEERDGGRLGGFAATMICGVGFVDEKMKVEVEVEAIVGE